MSEESSPTTIAVTGATGFVGARVVARLLDSGLSVRALARSSAKAGRVLSIDAISEGRLTVVEGDLLEPAAAARLVEGSQACIHLVGILRESRHRQTFRRVHVDATRVIVDACKSAGVDRLVHMSALGARPDGVCAYQRTKFEAEQIVRESGLSWTIFRPGLIHGPGGELDELMAGWARGKRAPWAFMPYFTRPRDATDGGPASEAALVAPVHVDDVAAVMVGCLDNADSFGEVYQLCGPDPIRFDAMLELVRDRTPGAKPSMHATGIPGDFAACQAGAAALIGLRDALPFDFGMARMSQEDTVTSLDKAAAELGFNPRSFRESAGACAAAL